MKTIYIVIHHDAHGENSHPIRAFRHKDAAEALKGGRELFKEIGDDSYDSILPLDLSDAETFEDVLAELRS